jgi:hypothetical protein
VLLNLKVCLLKQDSLSTRNRTAATAGDINDASAGTPHGS